MHHLPPPSILEAAARTGGWELAAAAPSRGAQPPVERGDCLALSDLLGLEEDEEVIYIVEDVD